jgi:iron(III) transport system substrate-binding protein
MRRLVALRALLKTTVATVAIFSVSLLTGCADSGANENSEVVVYTALDREFSEPVLSDFTKATKIRVLPKYDVESTKTVGLTNAIIAERARPRCDVFWNNEILNTLRLEKLGLLERYDPPTADAFDARWRSKNETWHGFAARARVLIVNKQLTEGQKRPGSIDDLADSKWRGKTGIAKPLFGTTATQAACLFAVWGDAKAEAYFRRLKTNDVQILGGNKRVAEMVAAGQLAFGLTDTDDAIIELESGMPVEIVYPDQGDGQIGTLFIPNTVSIIKGCPHPAAAKKLVDFLLSPRVEEQLSVGASAQIPLNPNVKGPVRMATPQTIKPMQVDFQLAADKWETAAKFIRQEFTAEE